MVKKKADKKKGKASEGKSKKALDFQQATLACIDTFQNKLDPETIKEWESYARGVVARDLLGGKCLFGGQDIFVAVNTMRLTSGRDITTVPCMS